MFFLSPKGRLSFCGERGPAAASATELNLIAKVTK
jgi:hypothetical protein